MKSELLAPAGNLEALKSAVNGGADAIYFGFGSLNARRNAIGFTDDELKEAFSLCHLRGVKIYITLNTEIFDRELSQLKADIKKCADYGADALIIEDMATYHLAKEITPSLPLHASTQMAVHNVSGAMLMKELGFSRVVLAREMSKEEIKRVCENVDIETEVFVHGALCYCVSGQCYISSLIGERSGNRGLCAQSCRLPFSIPGTNVENALSLKDLSLIKNLEELSKIGVTSFKIEGRMKRPEYVYTATSQARLAMDNQKVDYDTLRSVFSRSGFTSGYYDGKINKDMFGTRSKTDVLDGESVLKKIGVEMKKEYSHLNLDMRFKLKKNQPVELTAICDGDEVTVYGDVPQEAQKKSADRESVLRSLEKLGGTFFKEGEIETDIDDGLFISMSQINSLRREATDKICELRLSKPKMQINDVKIPNYKQEKHIQTNQKLRAEFHKLKSVPLNLVDEFETIYLPVSEAIKAAEEKKIPMEKLAIVMPRVAFENEKALSEKLKKAKDLGIEKVKSSNAGLLFMAREMGFSLSGGFGLNITNSLSLEEYKSLGIKDAVLSFELSFKNAEEIKRSVPCGIIAYGYLPAMVTRNCPLRAFRGCDKCNDSNRYITDRMGKDLQILCSGNYTEILNPLPLYLGDKKDMTGSFDFLELLFTTETKEECENVIKDFLSGNKRSDITRGLYQRKVL